MRRHTAGRYTTSKVQVLPETASSSVERATGRRDKASRTRAASTQHADSPVLPCQAEWQAILFRDSHALGKLVAPAVDCQPLTRPAGPEEDQGAGASGSTAAEGAAAAAGAGAVSQLSLRFEQLVAVGSGSSGEARPLYLPVDGDFSKHSYQVQVIGRQASSHFAVPHRYQAQGRELAAALSVQQQWQEFQQRHQAARTSAGQLTSAANFAHRSTLAVQAGDGLERLQAIFDVVTPAAAWLKGIVVQLLVAEPTPPGVGEPVDGGSSGGAGEHGGVAAAAEARAGEGAGASGGMAAPEALPEPGQVPSSWAPAKQRRPLEQLARQQMPAAASEAQLQQEWTGAQAAAAGAADGDAAGHIGGAGREFKRRGSKHASLRQREATQEAATAGPRPGSPAAAISPGNGDGQPSAAVERRPRAANRSSSRGSGSAPAAGHAAGRDSPAPTSVHGGSKARAGARAARHQPRTADTAADAAALPAGQAGAAGSTDLAVPTPAAAGTPAAAASVAAEAAVPAPSAAGAAAAAAATKALTPRRSRSRSGSRSGSRSRSSSRQEGSIVRRLPKLFPTAAASQQPQQAGCSNGHLASVPEGDQGPRPKPGEAAASGPSSTASGGPPPPSDPPRCRQQGASRTGEQPRAARSDDASPMQEAAGPAATGRTTAPVAAQPADMATEPAAATSWGWVAQVTAADVAAPQPDAYAAHVDAGGAMRGTEAAAAASPKPDAARGVAAPPPAPALDLTWSGCLDSCAAAAAAAAAAATPARPPPPAPRCSSATGSGSANDAGSSRPESVCSDDTGSGSQQSSDGLSMPGNPSEFGLSYKFGGTPPLVFQWQEPPGMPLPAQQRPVPPAHQQLAQQPRQQQQQQQHLKPPTDPNRHGRHNGSFGSSRSLPAAAAAAAAGGGAGFYLAAAHHPGSLPLPGAAGPMAFHRRSGSSSSSHSASSGSGGGSGSDAAAYGAAHQMGRGFGFHPSLQQQWHMGAGGAGWVESFGYPPHQHPHLPHQHHHHHHHQLSMQQPPFVPRSQSAPRAQWHPQQVAAAAAQADAYWQHAQRSSSSSWLPEVRQADGGAGMSVYCPLQQLPYFPSAVGAAAAAPSNRGQFERPAPAGGSRYGTANLPSRHSSKHGSVHRGQQNVPPQQTATPPPPPPMPVPVLDLQVQESADDAPDLERFLQAATPQVVPPASGLHNLTLADLWRWYEEPSTIGCEVATIGGPRGPATAYYLPYLSAVQLLVPASDDDAAAVAAASSAAAAGGRAASAAAAAAPAAPLLSYPNGLDSWPERMRPLVQWGEAANMRDRVPLHARLQDLCGRAGERHPLLATRIADLHPFSWFAVAWYPLYCVPETPLTARFLTFHTLASLWESASEAADRQQQQQEAQEAEAAAVQAVQDQQAAAGAEQEAGSHQAAADVAAGADGDPAADAGACAEASPLQQVGGLAGAEAASGAAAFSRLPSRPSYKSMLAAGLQQQHGAEGGSSQCGEAKAVEGAPAAAAAAAVPLNPVDTATPTTVCSFPGSPTCSEAGTRTTPGGSRPHSVDGGASGGGAGGVGASSADRAIGLGRSRLACSSSGGGGHCPSACGSTASTASSAAGSEGQEEGVGEEGGGCTLASASASPSLASSSTSASMASDDSEEPMGTAAPDPLPVPVAGLVWYATGRNENWSETLVAAQLPQDMQPSPGTLLADGARVVGLWRGVAVLARPYPVAKGGPLGWEIQQEEMAQCAERLATGSGLVALCPHPPRCAGSRGGSGGATGVNGGGAGGRAGASVAWERVVGLPPAALGVACPDYEFFCSRMQRMC